MPCSGEYLDPTRREAELQHTAKLLVYVYTRCGDRVKQWIRAEANNQYASDERLVPLLCRTLKRMSPEDLETVVYDAHDPTSRNLANWWEAHQDADRVKQWIRAEAQETHAANVAKAVLAKLTDEERAALALTDYRDRYPRTSQPH